MCMTWHGMSFSAVVACAVAHVLRVCTHFFVVEFQCTFMFSCSHIHSFTVWQRNPCLGSSDGIFIFSVQSNAGVLKFLQKQFQNTPHSILSMSADTLSALPPVYIAAGVCICCLHHGVSVYGTGMPNPSLSPALI